MHLLFYFYQLNVKNLNWKIFHFVFDITQIDYLIFKFHMVGEKGVEPLRFPGGF